MTRRTAALLGVLIAGVLLAWWSFRAVDKERALTRVCEAAKDEGPDAAIDAFRTLDRYGAAREGLECLCLATLRSVQRPVCLDALAAELSADASFVPAPLVAKIALRAFDDEGRSEPALALGRRARALYPDDAAFFALDVRNHILRSSDVDAVVQQELNTIAQHPQRHAFTVALAEILLEAGHGKLATRMVAELDPPTDRRVFQRWAKTLVIVAGRAGKRSYLDIVLQHKDRLDVPPEVVIAMYEFERSLNVAEVTVADHQRLAAALDVPDELARKHAQVFRLVSRRAIHSIAMSDKPRAQEMLKRARGVFPDFEMTEQDVERAATQSARANQVTDQPGTLRFVIPEKGRLRVGQPNIVARFTERPVPAGAAVEMKRPVGSSPVRWVFVDEAGQTVRAAGSVWPVGDKVVEVNIQATDSFPVQAYQPPPRKPGDGVRRVAAVLVDSGDWAIFQYGVARGEMPFFAWAQPRSIHARLLCVPATTAASVGKLLYPLSRRDRTYATFLADHVTQVGFAIQSQASLAGPLSLLGPSRINLFESLAEAGITSVSLVPDFTAAFSGHLVSQLYTSKQPHDPQPFPSAPRDPALDIAQTVPTFADWPTEDKQWGNDVTALFDRVDAAWANPAVQLVVAHVDPTDLAAHNALESLDSGTQETSFSIVRDLNRYVDIRLRHLYAQLDGDDVLVVFSDHGTTSSLAHSPHGVFMLLSDGIAADSATPRRFEIDGMAGLLHRLMLGRTAPGWPAGGFDTLDLPPLPEGQTQ